MRWIRELLHLIRLFFDATTLQIQLTFYFRRHTLQELEDRLIQLGCTKTVSHTGRIYTTANGVGKIVVTDTDIWINPK